MLQEEFVAGQDVVKEGDTFADRFYIVEEVCLTALTALGTGFCVGARGCLRWCSARGLRGCMCPQWHVLPPLHEVLDPLSLSCVLRVS